MMIASLLYIPLYLYQQLSNAIVAQDTYDLCTESIDTSTKLQAALCKGFPELWQDTGNLYDNRVLQSWRMSPINPANLLGS